MIIFYEKESGNIIGTIEGRVHGDTHLNQWIGDKNNTLRLIVKWRKNDEGTWEPNVEGQEQKDIFIKLDKNPTSVYDYYIESDSGNLVKRSN